ncbi:MAG TPA: hypothetical protein ENI19_00900 [Candidatus Nealsonbacteria bacterium]|uniref:Uncharacterized protein n=1 Tax=marine sediment metagenome TaxID=412755 RepID=A0A0F9UZD1_9ZZZZ|nr:hypothetical protein [Candidatus Nealsonbacteria bacterium]HEB46250.1 hypothetical protein [Candidatus Nealsonbacteria bacterium]
MAETFIKKEETLIRYNQLINIKLLAVSAYLLLVLILKIFFKIHFPDPVFFFICLIAISTIVYDLLFRQIKEPKTSQIIRGYFGYLLFDTITLTIIIYIIGGVTWTGFIYYGLYIYFGFLLFPRIYSISYTFYCSFLYTTLVIVQYLEILPYRYIFSSEEMVPQNLNYVVASWAVAVIFLLILGLYGDVFYKMLQKKIEGLQKTQKILEEERASLEIRVGARTKELWEERKSLEKKVKERTRELQRGREKLTKRVGELEEFHKLTVGRELKMTQLKREIERLKKRKK